MVETREPRPSSSVVSLDEEILTRILKRRRDDCEQLDRSILGDIVREKWLQLKPQSNETDAREQFVILLKVCFQRAADDNLPVSKRRRALENIKELQRELDSKINAQEKNLRDDDEETGTSNSTSGASPIHSIAVAQPTAKRPDPTTAVRNGAQNPSAIQSKHAHQNHSSSATARPNRSAAPAASHSPALQIGWGALNATSHATAGQLSHFPVNRPSAHSQPNRNATPAASTSQAPQVEWPLSNNTYASFGKSSHVSDYRSQSNGRATPAASLHQVPPVGWHSSSNTDASSGQSIRHVPEHRSSPNPQPNRTFTPAASTNQAPPVGRPASNANTHASAGTNDVNHSNRVLENRPSAISQPNPAATPPVSARSALQQGWPDSNSLASNGTYVYDHRFTSNQRVSQAASQSLPLSALPQNTNLQVPGRHVTAGASSGNHPSRWDVPAPSPMESRTGWLEPPSHPVNFQIPNPLSGSLNSAAAPPNPPPPPFRNNVADLGNPTPRSFTLAPAFQQNIPLNPSALGNTALPSTTSATSSLAEKNDLQLFQDTSVTTNIPSVQTIGYPEDRGVPVAMNSTKIKTLSGLLEARPNRLKVTCRPEPITKTMAEDLDRRILEWEPYRKPLGYVAMGLTSPVVSCQPAGNFARTAFSIKLDLTKSKLVVGGKGTTTLANCPGFNWGTKSKNGLELVLMMFPLSRTKEDQSKRADGHLWPKGSFLVVQNTPQEIQQRRQESHDRKLWKGSSYPFDLGAIIKDPRRTVTIDMCSFDENTYLFCVMLCAVRTPGQLFRQLTDPGPFALQRVSRDEAMELATAIAQRQVVQLDCDDDMDTELGKLVFSLFCPLSKTLMETPVRSNNCSHWQCFDLKFFLETNQHTSGARWRCGACDPRFVSPKELRICGLTAELIHEFKDVVSPLRNRIELTEDKTYRLLEERVRRRGIKRVSSTDGNGEHTKKKQIQEEIFIE